MWIYTKKNVDITKREIKEHKNQLSATFRDERFHV